MALRSEHIPAFYAAVAKLLASPPAGAPKAWLEWLVQPLDSIQVMRRFMARRAKALDLGPERLAVLRSTLLRKLRRHHQLPEHVREVGPPTWDVFRRELPPSWDGSTGALAYVLCLRAAGVRLSSESVRTVARHGCTNRISRGRTVAAQARIAAGARIRRYVRQFGGSVIAFPQSELLKAAGLSSLGEPTLRAALESIGWTSFGRGLNGERTWEPDPHRRASRPRLDGNAPHDLKALADAYGTRRRVTLGHDLERIGFFSDSANGWYPPEHLFDYLEEKGIKRAQLCATISQAVSHRGLPMRTVLNLLVAAYPEMSWNTPLLTSALKRSGVFAVGRSGIVQGR